MNRFWKVFRFGILLIAFISLGFYLFGSTDWDRVFGRLPMYPELTSEGQPVVDAVYKYKNQRGLWPEYLSDLVPEFLTPQQATVIEQHEWVYEIQDDRRPGFSSKDVKRRTHVGFDFDAKDPSWIIFGDMDNRKLKSMTPLPPPCTLPANKLLAAQLSELDRRIGCSAGPIVMEYYRDKVSLLREAGKFAEARRVLEAMQALNVHHFWPRLALVKLDLEQRSAGTGRAATASAPATRPAIPPSLAEFENWVSANPSFTHWYYVSLAYRWIDREAEAMAAIEEAAKLPPELGLGDEQNRAFYLWDMARYAIRHQRYKVVLALTDSWSKIEAHRSATEYSYLPLGAAARLATGDLAGAKANLKTLREEKLLATWADNVPVLQAAVERSDRTFVYDPGNKKPPFEVFSKPQ